MKEKHKSKKNKQTNKEKQRQKGTRGDKNYSQRMRAK